MISKKTRKKVRKYFGFLYAKPLTLLKQCVKANAIRKETIRLLDLQADETKKVFYLGITAHSNLGDMAQHYCILNWISEFYSDYKLVTFESDTVVDDRYGFISKFKKVFHEERDIIIFQSGYTSTDLGGNHDLMHRIIVDSIPNAHILMMPQTIYYKDNINKEITAKSLNKAKKMLFLARDQVSYDQACDMFPDITVKAFPDIVTTLIGTLKFNNKRSGVCLCVRDDSEKYYSDLELATLADKIINNGDKVVRTDTTIPVSYKKIRNNKKKYIEGEAEKFANFEITITDRYHGTILSLAAGTPVIIIKTTDHKVVTGADWFKNVYDEYVYVAEDLQDAFTIYLRLKNTILSHNLAPYFKKHYYDKLKSIFNSVI